MTVQDKDRTGTKVEGVVKKKAQGFPGGLGVKNPPNNAGD